MLVRPVATVPTGGGDPALLRALPLVAWVAALTAALAGAVALGAVPALAAPPLTRPGALAGWAAARPPVDAAFAVLRLVVVALVAYLLLVTVLGVVLRLVRAGRLVRAADLVTAPSVRRVIGSAFGVGLVGAALVASGPRGPAPVAERLVAAVEDAPPSEGALPVEAPELGPPTMRRVDLPSLAAVSGTEVAIGPGDHLWSVAERALAGAWGRPVSEAELTPFWARVVEANRDRLHDPGNPDLVFPGQAVAVPAPPPAPAP